MYKQEWMIIVRTGLIGDEVSSITAKVQQQAKPEEQSSLR